jgi:hypothetical protein
MRVSWLILAGMLLVSPIARAQAQVAGFDGERLAPATGAAGYVFVEQPVVPFNLGYGFGLFLHFADDAVVVRNAATGNVVGTPLDGAASLDLLASIGLLDRLELGIGFPVRIGSPRRSRSSTAETPGFGGRWAPPFPSPSPPVTTTRCAGLRA